MCQRGKHRSITASHFPRFHVSGAALALNMNLGLSARVCVSRLVIPLPRSKGSSSGKHPFTDFLLFFFVHCIQLGSSHFSNASCSIETTQKSSSVIFYKRTGTRHRQIIKWSTLVFHDLPLILNRYYCDTPLLEFHHGKIRSDVRERLYSVSIYPVKLGDKLKFVGFVFPIHKNGYVINCYAQEL